MIEMSGTASGEVVVQNDFPDDGFPPFDAERARPESLAACRDVADQLEYLCGVVRGSFTRTRDGEGNVWIRLKTQDGDVLSAKHPTTAECVAHLLTRVGVTA